MTAEMGHGPSTLCANGFVLSYITFPLICFVVKLYSMSVVTLFSIHGYRLLGFVIGLGGVFCSDL